MCFIVVTSDQLLFPFHPPAYGSVLKGCGKNHGAHNRRDLAGHIRRISHFLGKTLAAAMRTKVIREWVRQTSHLCVELNARSDVDRRLSRPGKDESAG